MNYLDKITPEERSVLNWIDVSFRDYFDQAIKHFQTEFPGLKISDASLQVENIVFTSNCDFNGEFECALEFKNCYFLNTMLFHDAKFHGNVSFNRCFCDNQLKIIQGVEFCKNFDLINLSIKRELVVDDGKFKDCKWRVIDNGIIKIGGGEYESLNIGYWGGGVILEELSFFFPKIKGFIKVTGGKSKIEKLFLFQFSSDVSIAIEDISVNCLSIYRFRNEKFFRLFNIKSHSGKLPSEFAISESYLGKAEFYSINLNSFDNVYLHNVHLADCSFVNVDWKFDIKSFKGRGIGKSEDEEQLPAKINKIERDEADEFFEIEELKRESSVLNYYSKNREVYRQLKYALGKQGDVINEQKFHTLEMLAYNRSVILERDFWTKLIIKMSHWFSDFGQSIVRPFWALVIGHWILFIILILSGHFSNLSISFTSPTENGFKEAFEQYFKLISPIRKADDSFEGFRIILDVAMRIWSSYMIYNLIRATRRFIK